MKRRLSVLFTLILAGALAGCGGGGGDGGGATSIRVADNWADSHPMAAAIDDIFKEKVEEATGGEITVTSHHSGTLGNEADLWDGVRNGTLEVAVIGTVMNEEYPLMLIADWPFLYRDLDHAINVWTGDIADDLSERFHEKFPETYILGWGPNSARTFTSAKKLEAVEDFKGQKFRMPSNPIHIGIAEGLGGSAQVVPLGELFTALETGVVDGQDNGMVTVRSEALYEVQDYVYETNHIIATLEFIVNAQFFDSLTEEQQEIVREAAKESTDQAWADYAESIDEDRTFLEEEGLTVTELTDADRDKMIEMLEPLNERLLSENEDWAPELVEQIQNLE